MNALTFVTFALATAAVALITWRWARRLAISDDATEEYFTGGRALSWPVVAGSLLLTNLSTEQLVGLNGDIFKDGALVGIAWEALAAFAMIATALVFLPRYLASGFTTTPAFLEKRFDKTTRSMVSGLFLAGYVTVLLPVVLVTGSSAIIGMFDLDVPFWLVATGIGVLGSGYAIVGGLKSVAISDTLNGIGLLVAGLAIPALGLAALGDGSMTAGLSSILERHPESLRVLTETNAAGQAVTVPWPTLLTGMMFIQIFYWSTNQVIVQRAMAARSLAEGQKGVLFASSMKLVGPLMLCLPGLLALQMMGELSFNGAEMLRGAIASATDPAQLATLAALIPGAGSGASKDALLAMLDGGTSVTLTLEAAREAGLSVNSRVYGLMVRHVLPDWSIGLFLAVLVGSILSSFNSALNSASTLFSLQFYKGYIARDAEPVDVVRAGKRFGTLIAVAA
ncbi:MAG: solute:sodium symporter family transporter, partial [Myxococcota bacterium]|nr:solute:sodium symporter family transporter [Myxococcota bacterium]